MIHKHSYKRHFQKPSNPIFIYVLLALATIFAFTQIINTGRRFETRSRAQINPVKLLLTPVESVLPPNRTVRLTLDGKDEKIVYVRVEITFDQNKVALASEIGTTSKLRQIIKKSTMSQANSTGRAVIMLGLAPTDRNAPPTGTYELATLNFMSKTTANTTTQVSIDTSALQVVNWDGSEMETQIQNAKLLLNPSSTQPTQPASVETKVSTQASDKGDDSNQPTSIDSPDVESGPTPTIGFLSPKPRNPATPSTPVRISIEGDVNGDECVNLSDVSSCLNVLWPFGRHSCDANSDGRSNISDLFYVLTRLGNGCE